MDRLLLEYPTYHSRYSELTRADFIPHSGATKEYWKGFSSNFNTVPLNKPEVHTITETMPLTSKNEEYLLKIINLSKENNIPLLLIVAPYQLNAENQKNLTISHNLLKSIMFLSLTTI